MNTFLCGSLSALALLAFTSPLRAQVVDSGIELAFMPRTMTVTLLNEGGKYVAVDLKHIPQGGTCRMDKDATIARVGPGATETTQVRYAAAQISAGGCPFMTTFELADADYAAARAAFVTKKEEAWKKVDGIKKELGEKWDEVTGKKKS
jgi:hypothetical protein